MYASGPSSARISLLTGLDLHADSGTRAAEGKPMRALSANLKWG